VFPEGINMTTGDSRVCRGELKPEEIRDEAIDVGGPSNISFDDLTSVIERELGVTATRRRIPPMTVEAFVARWFGKPGQSLT
jgi:hypothetical protein